MRSKTITRYRAAKMLGVDGRTIDRMVARGELKGEKNETNGEWVFDREEIEEAANERELSQGPEKIADRVVEAMKEATELQKAASDALKWLVTEQQSHIKALTEMVRTNTVEWADAIRDEASRALESRIAVAQEDRKDKALDELTKFIPQVMARSMSGRAGAKVLSKFVALSDEQWDTVKAMAVELLDMPQADVDELDALRSAEKKEKNNGNETE